MADIGDLRNTIKRNPVVKESMFDYHYNNGFYTVNMPEGPQKMDREAARAQFEEDLSDKFVSDVILRDYLPVYLRGLEGELSQTLQPSQPAQNQGRSPLVDKLIKAGGVTAVGLATIVIGYLTDNENHNAEILGALVAVGGAVGGAVVYAMDKLSRT